MLKDCPECKRHEIECSHEGCEYECPFECINGKVSAEISGAEIWKKYDKISFVEGVKLIIEQESFIPSSDVSNNISRILERIDEAQIPINKLGHHMFNLGLEKSKQIILEKVKQDG